MLKKIALSSIFFPFLCNNKTTIENSTINTKNMYSFTLIYIILSKHHI